MSSTTVNSAPERYYENTSEANWDVGEFCELDGLRCGVIATVFGGIVSTGIVSVLTSRIWPDTLYFVPLITMLAGVVFCGCAEQATKSEKASSKIGYGLVCGMSAIPALPFLIGALPTAGALYAVSTCIKKHNATRNQDNESYTEI